MTTAQHTHILPMLVKPAPDVPGEWLAICPKLGMVTQGSSPAHAIKMGMEAVEILWLSDIQEHRNPFEREDPTDPHIAEIEAFFEDSLVKSGSYDELMKALEADDATSIRAIVAHVIVWAQILHQTRPNAVGVRTANLMAMAS